MFATSTLPIATFVEGNDYDLSDGNRYSYQQIFDMSDAERQELGIARVVPASPVSSRFDVVGKSIALIDGIPTEISETSEIPVEDRQHRLLALIADVRWSVENGTMLFGMTRVPTDDRSKLMITGARQKAKEDPLYSTKWKMAPGVFETLDSVTLIALGDAIERHVADCFSNEERLSSLILAAVDHDELDAIDIGEGWPE